MRILLKQSKRLVMGLSILLGGTMTIPLQAQKAPDTATKKGKITIVKETVDSDGKKKIERIERSFDTDLNLETLGDVEIELENNTEIKYTKDGRIIQLKETNLAQEKKPFLGIQFKADEDGVIVTDVIENAAAQKAGLQKNDRITELGGTTITGIPDLLKVISQFKVGDQVAIQYQREGAAQTAQAILGERPVSQWSKKWDFDTDEHINKRDFNWRSSHGNMFMSCKGENACQRLAEMQGQAFLGVYIYSSKNGGAAVTSVIENTGAAVANLQRDDRITQINNKKIGSYHELIEEVKKRQPGDVVKVTYIRNGETQKVRATLSSLADAKPAQVKELETLCEKETPKVKEPTSVEPTVEPAQKEDKADEAGQRVSDLEGVTLDLFPNPSQGIVNIKFEGQNTALNISVLNVDGKEVYKEEVSDFGGAYNKQIDLTAYASGLYIINISQGKKTMSKQLVLD